MIADYESTYQEIARIHGEFDCHIHQNLFEFAAWLNLLKELRPKRGLEIGTFMLGTAECTVETVPSIERLVTIDVQNRRGPEELGRRLLRLGGRVVFCEGESVSPKIVESVRGLVGGKLDFAFIDGDHSYQSVSAEFSIYEPMVRSGGLMGFHDILAEPNWNDTHTVELQPVPGVREFWQELAMKHPSRCSVICVPPGPWGNYRIGIYAKP